MNLSSKSDEDLVELKRAYRESIREVEAVQRTRELEKEAAKNKSLVPEWDRMLRLSFLEGYHIGVGWKDDYIPGGPYISHPCEAHEFHRTDMSLEEFNARAALSKEQHERWMAGFHDGLEHRKALIRTHYSRFF